MTRIGRRLVEDFLLPALNQGTYGDLLKWIDRDKGYFSIRWSHKNAAKWTLDDTAVFQDWDRLKGHYHPEMKGYFMQAKQRFRAALYKLNSIRKLPCDDKHVKKYQLLFVKKNHRYIKEQNQKSIPTPVICRNTSFVKTPEHSSAEESLSSPPTSPGSDDSIKLLEEIECIKEYQLAQEKHLKIKSEPVSEDEAENNQQSFHDGAMADMPRTPHLPTLPMPVYSKCPLRQAGGENTQKRVESPHVLLVRTYHDSDSECEVPQLKRIKTEPLETVSDLCSASYDDAEESVSDIAMNLTTKSSDMEMLSR